MSHPCRKRSKRSRSSDSDCYHDSDNSDSPSDVLMEVVKPTPLKQEIIDIDSEDDNNGASSNSDDVGIAKSRPRRNVPMVDYTDFFADSDDELEEVKEQRKQLQMLSEEIRNLTSFLEHRTLSPKITNLSFLKHEINLNDYITFFRKYGRQIKSLTFETMSIQLLKQITNYCPNLESLVIRESTDEDIKFHYEVQGDSTCTTGRPVKRFGKLERLSLGSNHFLSDENNIRILFRILPKTLSSFQYTFQTLHDLGLILNGIKDEEALENFKNLKSFVIQYTKEKEDAEEIVLSQNQIRAISKLPFKSLDTLELVCGILEDVTGNDLRSLMQNFASSLKTFTIAGNMHGINTADKQVRFVVPNMRHLLSFSMGSVYEFEEDCDSTGSDDESESVQSTSVKHSVISLVDTSLVSIDVVFPEMPTLESLSLGNLVNIEKISPVMFPNLRSLRIGSNWTMSLHIPMPQPGGRDPNFPIFRLVRDLQLPDCLRDEYFATQIRQIFPSMRRVSINLPSVKCLRHFFNSMAYSPLEKLYLKTQYDFKGILESALFARPYVRVRHDSEDDDDDSYARNQPGTSASSHSSTEYGRSYMELMKLKDPENDDKVFSDFIKYYNIELPISSSDEILSTPHGISDLINLKTLVIAHVPRSIRIPTNSKLSHNHNLQTFHPSLRIGFIKYPLASQFFQYDLRKLKSLQTFRHGPNFQISCSYKLWNVVTYTQRGCMSHYNYKDKNAHNYRETDEDPYWNSDLLDEVYNANGDSKPKRARKLKVKIRPSAFANEQYKVKKEKLEKEQIDTSSMPKIKIDASVKKEVK